MTSAPKLPNQVSPSPKALPQLSPHRAAGRQGAADPSSRRNFFAEFGRFRTDVSDRTRPVRDRDPSRPRPPRRPPGALTIFGQALDHLHGRLEPGGVHGAGLRHLPVPSLTASRRSATAPGCVGGSGAGQPPPPCRPQHGKGQRGAGPPPHRPPAAAGARACPASQRSPCGAVQHAQSSAPARPRLAERARPPTPQYGQQPTPTFLPSLGAHVTSPTAAPFPSHRTAPGPSGARWET